MNFIYAILASVLVSALSLVGVLTFVLNDALLKKVLIRMVGFGAGGLIGGALFHLLPEALSQSATSLEVFFYVFVGFMFFFMVEKYLYWRHCHKENCDVHPFTYLNLIGDGIHNLIDGLIIGASFFVSPVVGWAATIAIIFHEIPQELGDFAVLVYGGFSKNKALWFNFLSATTAIVGTIIGYFSSSCVADFSKVLLPLAGGGFIYIAACDLVPQLHKHPDSKEATSSLVWFLGSAIFMLVLAVFMH
jgi:zinc and cadmium transporter